MVEEEIMLSYCLSSYACVVVVLLAAAAAAAALLDEHACCHSGGSTESLGTESITWCRVEWTAGCNAVH